MVDLGSLICVACVYLQQQLFVSVIKKHVEQLHMQINKYGKKMTSESLHRTRRRMTDIHVEHGY
jgi:hypothetical protein